MQVVAVAPVPDMLLLHPTTPAELSGIYKMFGSHKGRPFYRLVSADGEPMLTSGSQTKNTDFFEFSKFGYCLRWHPEEGHWLLGENARTVQVEYQSMRPCDDITLAGSPGELLTVTSIGPEGPARNQEIAIGSVLVSVDGDTESFTYESVHKVLQIEPPVVLQFKVPGLPDGPEGLVRLPVDAPYPCSVAIPWQVMEDGHWNMCERPVQCRSLEALPWSVTVRKFRRKPKELNCQFTLLPKLHAGRPAYQSQNGRFTICWAQDKLRWVIIDSHSTKTPFFPGAVVEATKATAYAKCFAPHPGAVRQHGGYWETRNPQHTRTLQVVPSKELVRKSAYEDMLQQTLMQLLSEALDPDCIKLPGVQDGKQRFDKARISRTIRDMDRVMSEANAHGLSNEELLSQFGAARRSLAGALLLELLHWQKDAEQAGTATLASWMETLTEMRALLRTDQADPDMEYEDGWTAMHFVAQYGKNEAWTYDAANTLLSFGANIEKATKLGLTPILLAIRTDRLENVRALLRLAWPQVMALPLQPISNAEANQLLLQEAKSGEFATLSAVLGGGGGVVPDVNCRGLLDGKTPLHLAAERNKANMVEFLCESGAHVDAVDNHGCSPLHLAAMSNSRTAVLVILRYGPQLTLRNASGKTPYMVALVAKSPEVVVDFKRLMVPWSEIEEILGKERLDMESSSWQELVRGKVRQLLKLGFGAETADPLDKSVQDQLQVWNQLVVLDPGSNESRKAMLLELRGVLLCKELLLPLLIMVGDSQLEAEDGVHYTNFLKYLLNNGISHFCSWLVSEATDKGLTSLKFTCSDLHENIGEELKRLTRSHVAWLHKPVAGRLQDDEKELSQADDEEEEPEEEVPEFEYAASVEEQDEEAQEAPAEVETQEAGVVDGIDDGEDGAGITSRDSDAESSLRGVSREQEDENVMDEASAPSRDPDAEVVEGQEEFWPPKRLKRKPKIGSRKVEAWPMLHHIYAHGELSWVSTKVERWSIYHALCELGKVEAFGTLQELVHFVVPEPYKLNTVSSRTGVRSITRPFWEKVYAHWLAATAKKLYRGLVARMQDRWSKVCVAQPKSVQDLLQLKGRYRKECQTVLPMLGEEVQETYHVMEAGGIRDILVFTITAESVAETEDILSSFAEMRLEEDGMELEFVSNDFWDESRVGKYTDIRLAVCTDLGHSTRLLVEVKIIQKEYLDIKSNTDLFVSLESGPFLEARKCMRLAMKLPSREEDGAEEVANGDGEDVAEAPVPTSQAASSTVSVNKPRWAHRPQQDGPDLVWCWTPVKAALAKVGELCPAKGAMRRKTHNLDSWIELHWNGKPLQPTADGIARLAKDQGHAMSKEELGELLSEEGINVPEADHQRLALELVQRNCRFYRLSAECGGGLAKVTDYVMLKMFSPDAESVLLQETFPSGPVTATRKATESLVNCAFKALRNNTPDFIESSYAVHDLDNTDDVWFTWETPPGAQGMPAGNRYFLLRATLKPDADPFHLLRATIGLQG
eukprot:TRINITY_DN1549_c0_g1_i1.p1 TRINITY_DN1549_c0_g1~~TRINITY_DN1549_c0_g1_i1.p1  ORF type:complete len:1563 (-),score=340.68 TRINITY_DN1549_c0_g1_i1:38-4531(-)